MKVVAFPGQGSQSRGMGRDLFPRFARHIEEANEILGYDIVELCLRDPKRQLSQTQFTQPALYVVNALSFLARQEKAGAEAVHCFLGHSLGEYNALFAAGAFDFGTGLRLVRRRGELMASASDGGMAAVTGISAEVVTAILREAGLADIDIASFNGPRQTVVSGPRKSIEAAEAAFVRKGADYIPLNVGAAFHSRYMAFMQAPFRALLERTALSPLGTTVIANATAQPYRGDDIVENLVAQICAPVRWTDCIRHVMAQGEIEFEEVGPGKVLTGMLAHILKQPARTLDEAPSPRPRPVPETGARRFCTGLGLDYAYVAGAPDDAITSSAMIIRLAQAGLLGMLGTSGRTLAELEAAIDGLQKNLGARAFGLHVGSRDKLDEVVALALRRDVRVLEVSDPASPCEGLVRYRASGAARRANRLIVRVARPETAVAFLAPPPRAILEQLAARGAIAPDDVVAAAGLPLASDLVAEPVPTQRASAVPLIVLVPALRRLLAQQAENCGYAEDAVYIGAGGEIGTPQAVAAAFVLGADFVATASINQCTIEAGTSDAVKSLLAGTNVDDTAPVPTAPGFEIGDTWQAMSKGVFFPARANRLREIWNGHERWDAIDANLRRQIEARYFQRSYDDVLSELSSSSGAVGHGPRERMAAVFKWYLASGREWALTGDARRRVDYLVRTDAAMGAFNTWAAQTPLSAWDRRHVDVIGVTLMEQAGRIRG